MLSKIMSLARSELVSISSDLPKVDNQLGVPGSGLLFEQNTNSQGRPEMRLKQSTSLITATLVGSGTVKIMSWNSNGQASTYELATLTASKSATFHVMRDGLPVVWFESNDFQGRIMFNITAPPPLLSRKLYALAAGWLPWR